MLLLFDIDATLLVTSRSGLYAMEEAGRALFRPDFTVAGVDFAGRLDPLILGDLFRMNGVEASAANFAAMRREYHESMVRRLAKPGVARALPGVLDLIAELSRREDAVLGLLTGNFAETGLLKLRAVGLDPEVFVVRAWGDLSPHSPPSRDHLVPVAFDAFRSRAKLGGPDGRVDPRYARVFSQTGGVDPRRVVVIGDTPHDVGCARAHNCRSVGVATGLHSVERLREAGADVVFPDLSETDRVLSALMHE